MKKRREKSALNRQVLWSPNESVDAFVIGCGCSQLRHRRVCRLQRSFHEVTLSKYLAKLWASSRNEKSLAPGGCEVFDSDENMACW